MAEEILFPVAVPAPGGVGIGVTLRIIAAVDTLFPTITELYAGSGSLQSTRSHQPLDDPWVLGVIFSHDFSR